jgi:hypothetical protein
MYNDSTHIYLITISESLVYYKYLIYYHNKYLFSLRIMYLLYTTDRRGHFNFMNSCFHLREFTVLTSWIHVFLHMEFTILTLRIQLCEFSISILWIHDFYFTNSRFQLHEFKISTSRLHNFNFMNSRFQLNEFTISDSWVTILTSRIHDSRVWIGAKNWNHEFVKLKSWIRENDSDNSRSFTTGLSYLWDVWH